MAIRYTSNNISNISNSVFFDANILIYLFWPSPSKNNLSEKYARIFAALLKKNISLYTNTFVISEVINRILRIEWDNQTSKKINFKDFRNSECGKTVQNDVFDIIKDRILKTFSITDKHLTNKDFDKLLVVDSLDFNDKVIVETCKEFNLILLTHDSDFSSTDLDILSLNIKNN